MDELNINQGMSPSVSEPEKVLLDNALLCAETEHEKAETLCHSYLASVFGDDFWKVNPVTAGGCSKSHVTVKHFRRRREVSKRKLKSKEF